MNLPSLRPAAGGVVAAVLIAAALLLARPGDQGGGQAPAAPVVRLWSVDLRRIVGITLTARTTGASQVWRRQGGRWSTTGQAHAAWQNGTPTLLSRPQVRPVADRPGDPARFGLASPRLVVGIELEDGRRRAALVGDRLPDGSGYYVTRGAGQPVHAIDTAWVDVLDRLAGAAPR